jgi:N-acetylmuramoyl-L-alanine amidase
MRKINKIVVHSTATPAGRVVTVEEIDRWHKARGWKGIGYHYVIGLNGERWIGRPEHEVGVHTRNHNHDSIGVVYVGGTLADVKTPADTRTALQKAELQKLLKELKIKYQCVIYGHRDFNATACPSFDAKNEYKNL